MDKGLFLRSLAVQALAIGIVFGVLIALPLGDDFFKDYGALEHMEAWGDNVPEGKITDFQRSVGKKDGESVVFSWILWPDRATADAAYEKMENDPRMQTMDMPFDGKRMIYGGFQPIFFASARDGEDKAP